MKTNNPVVLLSVSLSLVFASIPVGKAADAPPATGRIEGRVLNPSNGEYLERVRLTVEGASLETFSDSGGHYRLTNVPAGAARVRAFYTGLIAQTNPVTVAAGQTVTLDFNLSALPGRPVAGKEGEVVKLSEFLVTTSREMDSAAIAINEQRFAPNIKGVASTDEFGNVAEGSVGEFLKFLPGIAIEYEAGALARGISINGVPSDNVPILVNGFTLASAGGNNATARGAQMDMTSITATARIEVTYSPTPETPGDALAGAINMVPRSAFERSRPEFKANAYLMMRDSARELKRTPGPFEKSTYKIKPGFDFSYLRPVTKNFGFTLSGGHSENGTTEASIQNSWRGARDTTNATAFPHTTPDRPYLTATDVREGTKNAARTSFGATVDYRFTPNDRLSFSYQHYFIDFLVLNHSILHSITGVAAGNFTPTSTRGNPGQGELQLSNNFRDRTNSTSSPSLVWRHDGPVWKLEAGLGHSRARNTFRATDKGYFSTATARRTGATVSFADIFYLRPNTITVTDAAGAPLDPYNLNNYVLTAANSNPITSYALQTGAQASVQREFSGRAPFVLKAGVDFRHDRRDQRQASFAYAFVGADGRASTTPVGNDDVAARFLAQNYSQRPAPWGFPTWQRVDNVKLWDYYRANPTHITLNENAKYVAEVNGSKYAEELVSAAYLRGDLQLIDRRLKLIGGVRAEQTNVKAQGPLNDRSRNYRRDASGNVILTSGRPTPIVANTNSLEYSRLTVLERAATAEKEYLRLFPSLNASFNLRDNLIARAAYYHSVGRPNFNQYAGGLTLPDETVPPSATNRISVNNAAIKAWAARSVNVRLEYYFEGVGQVSVGAFQREFENFFGNVTFLPTPEFLALYGLDAGTYGPYEVATQHNIADTVRMTGVDFSYKQALTFLPRWARGMHVFANASTQRPVGDATANFQGFLPRKASWGLSLVREKFNIRMNWSYQSKNRLGARSGNSIEPGVFEWQSSRVFLDLLGEYYFTKRLGVYFTLRNVGDTPDQREVEGPNTPAHAQFRSREQAGSLWTFGVKGTF
ncbi:MAG: carboxypeptidase regulatory-like domain-containing protein [Verrucomicrobia bacterium]|nr:carboxypeptidase regulatory-like domain-containing protein [Verrucomicrobiota bacterium]